MLTRKQHELLMFIHERIKETGVSPSFDEMKEALDLASKSGIHRLITALEERGFIRRLAHRARALEVLRQPEDVTNKAPAKAANSNAAAAVIRPPEAKPAPANDVIEIPLADPSKSRIVKSPRVFADVKTGVIAGLLLSLSGASVQAASAVITGDGGWLFPAWESLSKVDNAGTARNFPHGERSEAALIHQS